MFEWLVARFKAKAEAEAKAKAEVEARQVLRAAGYCVLHKLQREASVSTKFKSCPICDEEDKIRLKQQTIKTAKRTAKRISEAKKQLGWDV